MEEVAEEPASLESVVAEAQAIEKQFAWQGAAEAYEKALELIADGDSLTVGDFCERRAYALYRSAFQAGTNEEFKRRIDSAILQYEAARKSYSQSEDRIGPSLALRCEAMISYSRYNMATKGMDKKAAIENSWDLAKQALDGFERAGETRLFGSTCNTLCGAGLICFPYAESYEERKKVLEETGEYCEKAVGFLRATDDKDMLAKAYLLAARQMILIRNMSPPSEKEGIDRIALEFVRKGFETDRDSAEQTVAREFIDASLPRSMSVEERDRLLDGVFRCAHEMSDHQAIGCTLEWQSALKGYECLESTSYDQGKASADECYRFAVEAAHHYSVVSHASVCSAPIEPWCLEIGYNILLAMVETDLDSKRRHAIRGLKAYEVSAGVAKDSAMPEYETDNLWGRAMLLADQARTEQTDAEKKRFFEEARASALECGRKLQALYPLDRFQGGSRWILACVEKELADLETDTDKKRKILTDGIAHAAESYEGLLETMFDWNLQIGYLYLGKSQYLRGELCLLLHAITNEGTDIALASESFDRAAEMHLKGEQPSRVAESLWKAAISYSTAGDRAKASERFSRAGEMFRQAAKDLPRLGRLYEDHALYMDAWAELEHARYHHERQEYEPARQSYERAASLLAKTKHWNVFAVNYTAWAMIEKAENLSRSDSNEEAEKAFQEAARLFTESRNSISRILETIDQKEESEMASQLMSAADMRRDYCLARVRIEKAKMLEREGLEAESAENYSEAAKMLEQVLDRVETDQDKKDLDLVLTLTRAWQKMTEAEGTVNPSLFGEAAVLFEKAKVLSTDKNTKLLVTGHSRFCRALEAGMEFSDTGEASLHADATRHLESAAKYYLKAGYQNASEYANASKLLFDGYVHMDRASKEEDQEKKARLFTLAEKVLEASAASYERSQYPGKKDQILKLLEKVRRDRELAVSLTRALRAPDILSATTSFSTPTATHETAVGAERFEHADIQATLIGRPVDLRVGEDFNLDIELVNAGRGAAQLTKVEKIVPDGFDVKQVPERYRLEDSYLNLRGRRLDSLKTEDVRLVLKPNAQGRFTLRPRVMYLDDSGKYKSHEPEPVEVTVREMGLSGWLKGPNSKR